MKGLSILLGLTAVSGVSYGIWQYMARRDTEEKYKAAVAALLTAKAEAPSIETNTDDVYRPVEGALMGVPGVQLMGSRVTPDFTRVNLMGAYGVTKV